MATAGVTGGKGKRVMAGHLEEVDIFSVAQFLMLQQKTGTLELNDDGKTGKVFFEGGQVIDAQDTEAGASEEVAFRLFQWKKGAFDFFATEKAAPKKIEKDTQTLLFELAVKMDEQSATATEQAPVEAAPAQATAADAPTPLRVKAVRQGKAVARLVRRPGAVAAIAGQPAMSETQFMQAVQDRLSVFIDELPETSGKEWRQERAAAAAAGTTETPTRRYGIILSILTTLLLITMIVVMLRKNRDDGGITPAGNHKNPPAEPQIELPPSYTFVTAPFTPEREVEDAIRKIAFRCTVTAIDVAGDSLDQAVVVLRKGTFWETKELSSSAEHDAAHVVNEIFSNPNCKSIQKIDLRVQAHVGLGDKLKEWTDVLIVNAQRAYHKANVTLKTDEECSRFLRFFSVQTKYE